MAHLHIPVFLTFIVMLSIISCTKKPEDRIRTGFKAGVELSKFMAAIVQQGVSSNGLRNITYLCGGTVLSSQWILTSADCVYIICYKPFDENKCSVLVGNWDLEAAEQYKVNALLMNDDFTVTNGDIALIQLKKPIFNGRVRSVRLNIEEVPLLSEAAIVGWGEWSVGSGYHRELSHTMVNITKCKSISPIKLCAIRENTGYCRGDVGGPLMIGDRQLGLMPSYNTENLCTGGEEMVFTNISYFARDIWADIKKIDPGYDQLP